MIEHSICYACAQPNALDKHTFGQDIHLKSQYRVASTHWGFEISPCLVLEIHATHWMYKYRYRMTMKWINHLSLGCALNRLHPPLTWSLFGVAYLIIWHLVTHACGHQACTRTPLRGDFLLPMARSYMLWNLSQVIISKISCVTCWIQHLHLLRMYIKYLSSFF